MILFKQKTVFFFKYRLRIVQIFGLQSIDFVLQISSCMEFVSLIILISEVQTNKQNKLFEIITTKDSSVWFVSLYFLVFYQQLNFFSQFLVFFSKCTRKKLKHTFCSCNIRVFQCICVCPLQKEIMSKLFVYVDYFAYSLFVFDSSK